MMSKSCKSFRDTVHGYISIPRDYCDSIIDTAHFQRLRRVEQTSARVLYPSARHDRFIHSLGVFHIGRRIFEHLKNHHQGDDWANSIDWKSLQITYEVACLLHDCGHSPFSHTFEKHYDYQSAAEQSLLKIIDNDEFSEDWMMQADAAPHEKVSAIVLLKIYGDTIDEIGGNKILAARMITGCKYLENSPHKSLENVFISLLHGRVIDADRIDYVCRDKWASGYSTISLDIDRLISSMSLVQDEDGLFKVCYNKSALTEIQSVLDIKNFQQLWVINHHKVVYDQDLFNKAVTELAQIISPGETPAKSLSLLFDYKSFLEAISIGQHTLYLPSDDDIIHLLKAHLEKNEFAKEWLSRKHKLIPLWKSTAEFISLFSDSIHSDHIAQDGWLRTHSKKEIDTYLVKKGIAAKSLFINATPKPKIIGGSEVYVKLRDSISCYTRLNMPTQNFNIKFFFYVYIPVEAKPYKDEILNLLKNKLRSLG